MPGNAKRKRRIGSKVIGNTPFSPLLNQLLAGLRPARRPPQTGRGWLALAAPEKAGPVTVYDRQGEPLKLSAAEKVAQGGGGTVYRFRANDRILIKLCKPDSVPGRKIQAMLELEECRNAPFLAWPLMPVFDRNRLIIGFAMRKCSGRTLRALYAPFQVKRFFPGWDKLQLAQVALNLVNGVQLLARQGVLISDFNPDNFLVNRHGKVQFIDCDSFQIAGKDGKTYLSKNFLPEFAAPELLLHQENFKRGRTPEQIRFSLAVVVYMILLSGLHPFAYCGGSDPATNLKTGKCPLDTRTKIRFPVSWTKSVSYLPDSLRELFRRMFVDGYGEPLRRPGLGELKSELEQYIAFLRKCGINSQHRAILPTTSRRRKK